MTIAVRGADAVRGAIAVGGAIAVRGDGVAALTCGHLLQAAGFTATIQRTPRVHPPALMVSASSQALFCDILSTPPPFSDLPRIEQRVVKWGPGARTVALPHSALVVSERFLLDRIADVVRVDRVPDEAPCWTIVAAKPLPQGSAEHAFGTRLATVVRVPLARGAPASTCWIESVQEGWLFLLPDGPGQGWLMSVGGRLESQLARSELVAGQVAHLSSEPPRAFPVHPRAAWPLADRGWLACGTAALAFDPLCGDGTGHALREAILASAVLRALSRGGDVEELLEHYQIRLVAGFKRHLSACRAFYETGGTAPWWTAAAASAREGIAWCDGRLDGAGPFRYRLRGFELERLP